MLQEISFMPTKVKQRIILLVVNGDLMANLYAKSPVSLSFKVGEVMFYAGLKHSINGVV